MNFRSYSAPPVEKFLLEDDMELTDIQKELQYSNYFRKQKDPRLYLPKIMFQGQLSGWAQDHEDFILKAFREKKTTVQMIDLDHPESESCSEFSGKSRTNTPVGETNFVIPKFIENSSILIPIKMSSSLKMPVKQSSDMNKMITEIRSFYATIEPDSENKPFQEICICVCKDQEGSRHIQNEIDKYNKEQIEFFFNQIVGSSYDLATNLFGNYVIQKIIPLLREQDSFKLILQFFDHICELSLHVYGCRVIQKLIDHLDDIKSIISELESHISELIISPNGNHVIQKCIDKDIDRGFLLKEFNSKAIPLAQQRYGCRILQKLFELCPVADTANIYNQITDPSNIGTLINDRYGNYVIQHLIFRNETFDLKIFNYILDNFFSLSKDKYSSNVVEECVKKANEKQLEKILEQFEKEIENKPILFLMCVDMYGNYVVQSFFNKCKDESLKTKSKNLIRPFLKEMKSISFAKHILPKLS